MTKNKTLMLTLFGVYWKDKPSNMGLNKTIIIVDTHNNPFKRDLSTWPYALKELIPFPDQKEYYDI